MLFIIRLDKPLYETFRKKLEESNLIVHKGKIVDTSFVDVPRQRNTREENKHIKETITLDELLDETKDKGKWLWADSAYTGEDQMKIIKKCKMQNNVY